MVNRFVLLITLMSAVEGAFGQEVPIHTVTEISSLLPKAKGRPERVSLLLEGALLYILRPGMERSDYDSALLFLNQAMEQTTAPEAPLLKARCCNVYSQLYREDHQKEKGKKYIDTAIAIFTIHNEKEALGDAYLELQNYYDVYSESEWPQRVNYAETAERLYREVGNKFKQAEVLKHLGDFYQIKEADSIALIHLHASLAIYKELKYPQVQSVYDLIGYILYHHNDLQQALKYGLLAVEVGEKYKPGSSELSTIYNRVGLTCYRLTQYREAVNYFTRSFAIAIDQKDTGAAAVIAPNLMDAYMRIKDQQGLISFLQRNKFLYDKGAAIHKINYLTTFVLAYLITGDHESASPYVEALQNLVGNTDDEGRLRNLQRALIPYLLASQRYKDMYRYLPANERYCRKYRNFNGLADNYLWWYKADSALGNYPASIAHYKLYKEASDTSLTMKANQQINQLLIQHEAYKKDQEISAKESNIIYLKEEAKMQEAQLQQAKLLRNLTYVLVALLLLVISLLFNRYRLKQRTNKKLEKQQQEIARKNNSLQQLVTEKEWLVKEIHHRVKNNLQTVMALLGTQSGYLKNEEAITAIQDSQQRIQTMSLIHQRLYQSNNLLSVKMADYIHELVGSLRDSQGSHNRIHFMIDVDPIELDVAHVIPLGLIVNEAVTNCFKYAFPGQRYGVITIELKAPQQEEWLLVIKDDGVGLPRGFDIHQADSMGMHLIRGLCDQLDAQLSITSENGTCITIYFTADLQADLANTHTQSATAN
ncbi:histidine kinase dimerization/phosphoacceptor domain -containing protein [Paraflavitalea sp. CAU 1676]|uniref:tetratricopeptide repeat-containing sensor histidine kinase n=1 Tax=Paraflavitalea sp. CAU 1676 TaxID=3032598 RepID=UPI0023DCB3EE|nr:histidine kinase dimerization/phosphoacceptor domain -containing protein [Paraflavitalea sp. CAU 1676]MDF2191921.1 histidine kinase dimerization/phosphoacceptor domain -containing protein [Paraflavitalea sp. CAU 1676]